MKEIGKMIKECRKSLKVNQLELRNWRVWASIRWWAIEREKAILNWRHCFPLELIKVRKNV